MTYDGKTATDPALAPETSEPKVLGRRLGQVLVDLGFVRGDDRLLALYEQELGDDRRIGEILVAAGQVTSGQVQAALDVQATERRIAGVRERRLGDVLRDLGFVVSADVLLAAYEQELGSGQRIGELLVGSGRLTEAQLQLALQAQAAEREAVLADLPALPTPPADAEKWSYSSRGRWILPLQWASIAGVAFSIVRFASSTRALYPLLATFAFTAFYFLLGQSAAVAGRGRFDREAHEARVAGWAPSSYPTVDVFLPTCNEPLAVIENTWRHVAALEYPGEINVYSLDDAGRPELAALAGRMGFRYFNRPTNEFKKAGNLRYAYERTEGEFVVIFDADFAPRPDFLELLAYTDDPEIGIVQSPQYFDVTRTQGWLERGAGAVQELFYRHVQQGRSALGAPICVGSNAVYRRSALALVGGTALIEHSEDVHTGFRLMSAGFRTLFVPLVMAKGLCPDRLPAFFNQQYRWCAGSMSLLRSRAFWTAKMSLRQRACFISGFVYYIHTALWTFIAPLPALLMIWFFPNLIALHNYLPLAPAAITTWLAFPLWHRHRYPRLAAERVRMIYGYAHLFALIDTLSGRTQEWSATGGTTQARGRYPAFRRVLSAWSTLLVAAFVGGIGLRLTQGYSSTALAPLSLFTAYFTWQTVVTRVTAHRDARPASAPVVTTAARHAAPPVVAEAAVSGGGRGARLGSVLQDIS